LLDVKSIRLIESENFRWKPIYGATSQRLIVVVAAIALWRGDVAILEVVFLDWWRRRRFLRFGVVLVGMLALFVRSTHVIPLNRMNRPQTS
jgi:hypothetical protein